MKYKYAFLIQKKNKVSGRWETWYSFHTDKNRHMREMEEIFPGAELRVVDNPKFKGKIEW